MRSSIQEGDIRLGTLLIPISNLPLEDEVPTVEKWFRFDSVAEGSKVGETDILIRYDYLE